MYFGAKKFLKSALDSELEMVCPVSESTCPNGSQEAKVASWPNADLLQNSIHLQIEIALFRRFDSYCLDEKEFRGKTAGGNQPAAKMKPNDGHESSERITVHRSNSILIDMGSTSADDELDLVDLLNRCENDAELAIAVMESFYSQGSRHCLMLIKSLKDRKRDQLLLHAVCPPTFLSLTFRMQIAMLPRLTSKLCALKQDFLCGSARNVGAIGISRFASRLFAVLGSPTTANAAQADQFDIPREIDQVVESLVATFFAVRRRWICPQEHISP